MNEQTNPGANTLQQDRTLVLKILNEQDQILKTVKIKTALSVDEVAKAVDLNLYESRVKIEALQMIKEKLDPLVKLGNDSLNLMPVLFQTMQELSEAKKLNEANYLTILKLKNDYLEFRQKILDDNIESEDK